MPFCTLFIDMFYNLLCIVCDENSAMFPFFLGCIEMFYGLRELLVIKFYLLGKDLTLDYIPSLH